MAEAEASDFGLVVDIIRPNFTVCQSTLHDPPAGQAAWMTICIPGDVKRFDRQAAGELFDLAVTQSGGVRAAVKDFDGFDFGFVVFDELTETGDQCFSSFFGFGVKTGGQQLVAGEFVDHLMLGTQQDFAKLRVVKWEQGGFDLLGFDFVKLGVGDFFGRDAQFAGGEVGQIKGTQHAAHCSLFELRPLALPQYLPANSANSRESLY